MTDEFNITVVQWNSTAFSYTKLATNETNISNLRGHENKPVRMDNNVWTKLYSAPAVTRYGDLYVAVDEVSWNLVPEITQYSLNATDHFPAITTEPPPLPLTHHLLQGSRPTNFLTGN
ncbi:hypothetical protein E8E11_005724 [Didymella keratinophila]|nr:hypothetical protein E8E11_005724 [Didymella keratinophila]